jgi:hypothetical protein
MNPPRPDPQPRPLAIRRPKKELTGDQRKRIVSRLLWELQENSVDGKFARGILTAVGHEFHVCNKTIRRVWARAIQNFGDPDIRQFRSSPLKKNCGRPKLWNHDEVREAVKLVPLFQRRSIRDLAAALGIPKSTLHDMKCDTDDPVIIPCTSALKPALTEHHKLLRACYCVSRIDTETRLFNDFFQAVHVDEKWFFISEQELRVYIAPGENVPNRVCQNKDHILKVMFLCAVARPRYDRNGDCTFDGKLGMFPFVERVAAQRTSENRPRGTIITRTVPVNKVRYRQFMIEKVVPAIKDKWPDRNRNIVIQQDGASSHIEEDDADFVAAATQGIWNISLETQAAKSPDLNVLDLSFFRALQSHQWRSGFANTMDELILQVQRAYDAFEPRKLDFAFLTLQCCIDDILTIYGDNDYAIRHMGKESMLRDGTLPVSIVPSAASLEVFDMLQGEGHERVDVAEEDNVDPPIAVDAAA